MAEELRSSELRRSDALKDAAQGEAELTNHNRFAGVVAKANTLEGLIGKALMRVGQANSDQAGSLTAALGELYIKTPDQLRESLDNNVLGQVWPRPNLNPSPNPN